MSPDDGADHEFDAMADWTVDSVERLGADHAIPAACRGSGGPAALRWLADWLIADPSSRFADVGAGLGGPGAWLAREHGVTPVLVEPMTRAAEGARRLFDLPALVATAQELPLADGSFDAAWCLGVLSTTIDKAGVLSELRRTLHPTGRAGLVAYVAAGVAIDEPEGNHFLPWSELIDLVDAAGFHLDQSVTLDDLPDAPDDWDERAAAVDDDIEQYHHGDDRWQRSHQDEQKVAQLLSDGEVVGHALRLINARVQG
jgi:SAM-dependent methyltransferase